MNRLILSLCILLLASSSFSSESTLGDSIPKRVKTITGTAYDVGMGREVVAYLRRYDKKGNLTEEGDQRMYYSKTLTYDSLNRVTEMGFFCGESSGNGYSSYTYTDSSVCETFDGAVHFCETCDYFSKDGRLKNTREIFISEDFKGHKDTLWFDVNYHQNFNSRGLLESQKICSTSVYSETRDSSVSEQINFYVYSDFDSIVSVTKLDKTGLIDQRIVYTYDPNTHKKTDEYIFTGDVAGDYFDTPLHRFIGHYSHAIFEYDENGLLKSKETRGYCKDLTQQPQEKWIEFVQYKNGLLDESRLFDPCDGVCTEEIYYVYEFWK